MRVRVWLHLSPGSKAFVRSAKQLTAAQETKQLGLVLELKCTAVFPFFIFSFF